MNIYKYCILLLNIVKNKYMFNILLLFYKINVDNRLLQYNKQTLFHFSNLYGAKILIY